MRDHKMKTHTKLVLAATAIVTGVAVGGYALTAQADGGKRGHGGPHGGMRAMQMFDRFDTNKDGKVTTEEAEGLVDGRMASFDKDGTPGLSLEEYKQLHLAIMHDRIAGRFLKLDQNDDGIVDAAELKAPASRMIRWIDEDGDNAVTIREAKMAMGKHGKHRRHHDYDDYDK
jgi:Ca2+-binding EF-hand superfamily protein